jgi:drug/metabolite transporter (DMT)-like permease
MNTETKGLWLGFLGVVIFAMTLPMTRLAVGPLDDPQLSPLFVAAGRAAVAAVLSAVYLFVTRAARPQLRHVSTLIVCAVGTVICFPLFLGLALREVDAVHAAVVTGLLPLATASSAAIAMRQRPSRGFWACAVLGCALVVGFGLLKSGGVTAADGWLLLAVSTTSVGYVAGAKLSAEWPGEHVICWVLVISAPLTWPLAWYAFPAQPISAPAWAGFTYVTLFSVWIGFFAWYRGLALGGTVRVSQVQLVQPFLSMMFAVPVLGERLDAATLCFALAVVATVFVGKRMPAGAPALLPSAPSSRTSP